MTAGIYAIRNQLDGKEYIGQTGDIKKRWREHRCALRLNAHHSPKLQRAWNKYGATTFHFAILEVVTDLTLLDEREHHHADMRQPFYNCGPLGITRRKLSGLQFSEVTRTRVEAAFREIEATGAVVMPSDIAQRVGLTAGTVGKVLRVSSFWTPVHAKAVQREVTRRSLKANAQAGYLNLHAARKRSSELGHPGLQQRNELLRSQGFPNLRRGLETMRANPQIWLEAGKKRRGRPHQTTYSLEVWHGTHERIMAAVDRCTTSGSVLTVSGIARDTGVSNGAVRRHLRAAGIWDNETAHAALLATGRLNAQREALKRAGLSLPS